jgi:NodT family efflux transporter outer membrane factor (OMF) lipoprotein
MHSHTQHGRLSKRSGRWSRSDARPGWPRPWSRACVLAWLAIVLWLPCLAGCTSISEYVRNGFKVGPNYGRPPAPVATDWIDAADKRVRTDSDDVDQWWTVFNDPVLNKLIENAYRQNLTLREAGFRVLMARAQLGISVGDLFPQTQFSDGDFTNKGVSVNVANRQATPERWFGQWDYGFGLAWELDFWGRFRRAVEAADDELDASIEDYDDVLVTLLADVGTNYVQYRTFERRIELAQSSVKLFEKMLAVPAARYQGNDSNRAPVDVATANLAQARALIPQLEIGKREAQNRLCILLGMPPRDLEAELGKAPIPVAPVDVAVGIPADLLRRRPDVRRAERQAAAQSARIGIAESEFYPQIALNGTLGWSSEDLNNLFTKNSFRGTAGPSFQWNILNYGRLANNVDYQDAYFQELVTTYQQTVLRADSEVEDALVSFLKSQEQAKQLQVSSSAWRDGTSLMDAQYQGNLVDFTLVGYFQQNVLEQQDQAAQAEGNIALSLVQVYRALGGGWQIRLAGNSADGACPPTPAPDAEPLAVPPAAASEPLSEPLPLLQPSGAQAPSAPPDQAAKEKP